MDSYKRKEVKEPGLMYAILVGIARWLLKVFFGHRVKYEDPVPKTGPLMVLGSHAGIFDSAYMAAAVKGRKLHFVTTERFFHQRFAGWFMHRMGVLPRLQFHPDPRSIATMLRIMKNGGAIGLFPAGQTSLGGLPGNIAPSIVRLLKKSGATVVAQNIHGSFFTKSRFAPGINRGRVDSRIKIIFTPEELAAASDSEVYETVCKALYYDEFKWQEETHALFKSRARAAGYEKILYKCPRCGAEYRMKSEKHRFFCEACQNAAIVGRDMHMRPENESCVIYPTMRDWLRTLEDEVRAQVDDASKPFVMESPARLELYNGNLRYGAGQGVLYINREEIGFKGEIDGQAESIAIKHSALPGMPAETGVYMELYDAERGAVRYIPQNPLCVTKWKIAQEYLYSKTIALEK